MKKIQNYIGGEFLEPGTQKYLDNMDPSRGEVYSLIPDSGQGDVDRAVKAAAEAFPHWSGLSAAERSRYLLRISELIDKN